MNNQEPIIRKKTIEVVNGGEIFIIHNKFIRLITSPEANSKSCNVYIVDLEDPIVVPVSLNTLKIKLGYFN